MVEQITEGFFGLVLFVSHWLSPGVSQEEIRLAALHETGDGYVLECGIAISWSSQLADLIDAGIPLRFRMTAAGNAGDTASFVRTLRFDIATSSYAFTDTIVSGTAADSVYESRSYTQALVALRDYCRWTVLMGPGTESCRIEAKLLPSHASRLNRSVDMSDICGCRQFTRSVVFQEGESGGGGGRKGKR
jgi:hypothetical protein